MNQDVRRTTRVSLDWSRLLGFDQIRSAAGASSARIGAKVGVKAQKAKPASITLIGAKVGFKPQASLVRIGAKVGFKPTTSA